MEADTAEKRAQKEAQSQMRSSFFQDVYACVRFIPKGKVATYGQISTFLGNPRAVRVVGWALHGNTSLFVPCHRVVSKDGRVAPSYAFWGKDVQKKRLLEEGVSFLDQDHVYLKESQVSSEVFFRKAVKR